MTGTNAVLILYKDENKQTFREKIGDALDQLVEDRDITGREVVGSSGRVSGSEYHAYRLDVYEYFDEYREFDDFIISLVRDHGIDDLEESGLVIGHLNGGDFYTDYNHFGQTAAHQTLKGGERQ